MNLTNSTNSSVVNAASNSLLLSPRSLYEVIFESMSVIIIVILAVFGNILIFGVVYKGGLSRSSNLLMINLAMTDVMTSLLSFPLLFVTIATGKWVMGDVMCKFQAFCSYALYACTLCTLSVVSLNRYSLLCKPHLHRFIFRGRRTVAIVIGIWVTSLCFATPPLVGWSRYIFLSDYAICVTDPIASPSFNMFLFLFLLVNMLIIIISYTKIFTTLKNMKKVNPADPNAVANHEPGAFAANHEPGSPAANHEPGAPAANHEPGSPAANHEPGSPAANHEPGSPAANHDPGAPAANHDPGAPQSNQNQTMKSKELEITAIIFIIICLFGFCYLPTFIVGFFVFSSSPITRSMRLFSTFSISLTSVVNPFVYATKCKTYRKLVKKVYRRITGCC